MRIYTIYRSTNVVNGKVYVGFDSNWPTRKYAHRCNAFNPNTTDYSCAFHSAIRKYGKDNFIWDLLYQSMDFEHAFHEMESYFIAEYRSNEKPHGYNMTGGGGVGCLGFKHTEEHLTSITGKNNRLYDHTQYTFRHPEHGIFVGTALELIGAYPDMDIDRSQLTRVVKRKRVSVKGWKLIGIDGNEIEERFRKPNNGELNPMYDPTVHVFEHQIHGQFLGTRYELIQAYKETKIQPFSLKQIIDDHSRTCHGWRHVSIKRE